MEKRVENKKQQLFKNQKKDFFQQLRRRECTKSMRKRKLVGKNAYDYGEIRDLWKTEPEIKRIIYSLK